ncbi:hypothetical protein CRUP_003784, partial [Coryphaenoides rupestris]
MQSWCCRGELLFPDTTIDLLRDQFSRKVFCPHHASVVLQRRWSRHSGDNVAFHRQGVAAWRGAARRGGNAAYDEKKEEKEQRWPHATSSSLDRCAPRSPPHSKSCSTQIIFFCSSAILSLTTRTRSSGPAHTSGSTLAYRQATPSSSFSLDRHCLTKSSSDSTRRGSLLW